MFYHEFEVIFAGLNELSYLSMYLMSIIIMLSSTYFPQYFMCWANFGIVSLNNLMRKRSASISERGKILFLCVQKV